MPPYKQLPPLTHLLYTPDQFGLAAYISDGNGKPLKVHDLDYGQRSASGMIAGEPGQKFSVTFVEQRTEKPKKGYSISLYFGEKHIDGEWLRAADAPWDEPPNHQRRFFTYSETRVDDHSVRPFTFGKIQTTDDQSEVTEDTNFAQDISTIRFKYRRIKNARLVKETAEEKAAKRARKKTANEDPLSSLDNRKINEKADKGAFALAASYGNAVTKKLKLSKSEKKTAAKRYTYDFLDPLVPDLTFTFRIRSQAWFDKREEDQSSHATPPPAPPERPETPPIHLNDGAMCLDMDEDEVDRLIEREDAEIAAGKRKAEGAHQGPRKRVQLEDLEASDDEEEEEEEEEEDGDGVEGGAGAGVPFFPSDDESGSDGEGYYARGEHARAKSQAGSQPTVLQPLVQVQMPSSVASGSGTVCASQGMVE
ncbi:hypothetical protein JCM10207_003008 [Rhodosporidiobolus poonsookiae]